jgi:hypothetical protein
VKDSVWEWKSAMESGLGSDSASASLLAKESVSAWLLASALD